MSEHTPGPWTLSPFGRGVDVVVGERIVAECKATTGSELPSCDANARLIAAAPKLADVARHAKMLCAAIANKHTRTLKTSGPCCMMCDLYNEATAALADAGLEE